MKKLEFMRLEYRVLFEAAAAVEFVDAMENNDPNANMNETDRQAQEERDAIKNAPVENTTAQAVRPDMSDPTDLSDIDAEIQALVEGEIGFGNASERVENAIGELLNGFCANAVQDVIDDAFAQSDSELVKFEIQNSNTTVSTGNKLVIINSTVQNADQIIAALASNQEVLVLDSDANAFEQINEHLENSDKITVPFTLSATAATVISRCLGSVTARRISTPPTGRRSERI